MFIHKHATARWTAKRDEVKIACTHGASNQIDIISENIKKKYKKRIDPNGVFIILTGFNMSNFQRLFGCLLTGQFIDRASIHTQ